MFMCPTQQNRKLPEGFEQSLSKGKVGWWGRPSQGTCSAHAQAVNTISPWAPECLEATCSLKAQQGPAGLQSCYIEEPQPRLSRQPEGLRWRCVEGCRPASMWCTFLQDHVSDKRVLICSARINCLALPDGEKTRADLCSGRGACAAAMPMRGGRQDLVLQWISISTP
ncbi:hypothetical protein Cadr_000004151 [Camelus dromedarius]|uniref:Uncharacterized protein n=1 Tax=Camelus dromedarius TaxID=9838 RepID=A0A5N4ECE8_CAMDR|nr:hypothetical protein Cadr_000004151 [Camelus dromedarius]